MLYDFTDILYVEYIVKPKTNPVILFFVCNIQCEKNIKVCGLLRKNISYCIKNILCVTILLYKYYKNYIVYYNRNIYLQCANCYLVSQCLILLFQLLLLIRRLIIRERLSFGLFCSKKSSSITKTRHIFNFCFRFVATTTLHHLFLNLF